MMNEEMKGHGKRPRVFPQPEREDAAEGNALTEMESPPTPQTIIGGDNCQAR